MKETDNTIRRVVDTLNLGGHEAVRINTVGIRGRTISKRSLGVGDILCCWKGGLWLEIEVKTGNDRQRPEQKIRQERVSKAGGVYIIIKTFDEFLKWYENYK